jgi:hypothetical protein
VRQRLIASRIVVLSKTFSGTLETAFVVADFDLEVFVSDGSDFGWVLPLSWLFLDASRFVRFPVRPASSCWGGETVLLVPLEDGLFGGILIWWLLYFVHSILKQKFLILSGIALLHKIYLTAVIPFFYFVDFGS